MGEAGSASTELLLREQKQMLWTQRIPSLPASPAGPEPRRRACPGRGPGEPHRGERRPGASTASGLPVYPERSRRASTVSGDTLRGDEDKALTAVSNRNTNERRKLTTLSEPTTSKFLIATKLHFSEEKAKSEEKTNLLEASKTIVLGMTDADGETRGPARCQRRTCILNARIATSASKVGTRCPRIGRERPEPAEERR